MKDETIGDVDVRVLSSGDVVLAIPAALYGGGMEATATLDQGEAVRLALWLIRNSYQPKRADE